MSYNPLPQPADVVVISAGSSVTEVNRFPVGIGSTGFVSLKQGSTPISFTNPLPVSLGSSSIIITGNVNVGTTVSVTSSPESPVHNHITEVGTSDILTVPYLPVGIMKNGVPVSDTVALPTRVLNDEGLIAYARGAAVTETDVASAFLIDKTGATTGLGTSPETMSTVWSATGLYPWQTYTGSGNKLYAKTLVNDPKIQGKSITIEGLNSSYAVISETVTFDATDTTTPVSTLANFYRVNRIYLSGNNTNSLPHDKDVYVTYGSSGGTVIAKLTAPWGRGQNCFYTVPAGYEAFLLNLNGNSGKDDEITSSFWLRTFNGSWELKLAYKFISGLYDHNMRTPLRIPEKSDVEIRAFALVEASNVGTSFQLLVIPKKVV
jgi:hypothetical protein